VVRRRIVLRAVAAAILAICLFGLPMAVGVFQYFSADERAELERLADAAALSVADELAGNQAVPLPDTDPDTRLALYSPAGTLRAGRGPATADEVVSHAGDGQVATGEEGGDLLVAVPISDQGTITGIVRGATARTETYQRTVLIWLAMLGLAGVAIGATWLLARRMAGTLARPLEELGTAAKRLGEGDFTVRTGRSGIPEIDSVAEALDTTAQRIGETLDRERALSANTSHQLRTPLAGLRLELEAALDSPDRDPRDALAGGIAAADRLEAIIEDLLTLARRSPAPGQPADLDALLTEVREHWHGPLAARGRVLRIDTDHAPRPRAAPAAIRQILAVLVDNAVTHGRGTVAVVARDSGNALAIDVSDDGPGIDPDRDVFDRAASDPGHGIGLALARSLAEAEGGRLLLRHPAPPTFTLLLPVNGVPVTEP
jgi:signal transduction histidine kinase